MTDHASALTRGYWKTLGEGTLYENFQIIDKTAALTRPGINAPGTHKRIVQGIVVLGGPPRVVTGAQENQTERKALSLDGADVIVIKARAAPLSAGLFGQALISRDLIHQRWQPRSARSVMIYAEEDPELRPIVDSFPPIEARLDASQGCSPGDRNPRRLPASAQIAARHLAMPVVADPRRGMASGAQLATHLSIDGVAISGLTPADQHAGFSPHLVAGRHVISVHSYYMSRRDQAGLGMDGCGEVIISQILLKKMGAARVESAVVTHHDDGDRAIEQALSQHVQCRLIPA